MAAFVVAADGSFPPTKLTQGGSLDRRGQSTGRTPAAAIWACVRHRNVVVLEVAVESDGADEPELYGAAESAEYVQGTDQPPLEDRRALVGEDCRRPAGTRSPFGGGAARSVGARGFGDAALAESRRMAGWPEMRDE